MGRLKPAPRGFIVSGFREQRKNCSIGGVMLFSVGPAATEIHILAGGMM